VVFWPCLRSENVSPILVLLRRPGIDIISETDGYIDNATQKGWLTAILELGAWFGALFSGFVAEVLSRKYGILCATGVFIVGVVVQITAIAGGHNEILAGRFIT
jgi:MFS family permease